VSDPYSSERYSATLAHCHTLHLLFNGLALVLSNGRTASSYPAVSGRSDNERFVYTTARQRQSGGGPIPEGTYWIRPDELWENAWYRLGSTSAWGNYRVSIHPFPTTQTFGRGGFFIHGGTSPGSAGCIDLTLNMDRFVADLKRDLGGKILCQIHLVVSYVRRP
jgi:hypothetical protein